MTSGSDLLEATGQKMTSGQDFGKVQRYGTLPASNCSSPAQVPSDLHPMPSSLLKSQETTCKNCQFHLSAQSWNSQVRPLWFIEKETE
jgi:hypothetical protein